MSLPNDVAKELERLQRRLSTAGDREALLAAERAAAGFGATNAVRGVLDQLANPAVGEIARALGPAGIADFARELAEMAGPDIARLAADPSTAEAFESAARPAMTAAAGEVAGVGVAQILDELGADQRDALAGALSGLAALDSVDLPGIAERLGTKGVADLASQLGASGLAELSSLAEQVGITQRQSLGSALAAVGGVDLKGLQEAVGRIVSVMDQSLGEIDPQVLRDIEQQVGALQGDAVAARFEPELAELKAGIDEALKAPVLVAARELRRLDSGMAANGQESLGALQAAAAYLAEQAEALPHELACDIDVPTVSLGPRASQELFDQEARRLVGMSGDEFLRRWALGELKDIADHPDHPGIMQLAMMISLAR